MASKRTPKQDQGIPPSTRRVIVAGVKAGVPWNVCASRAGVTAHQLRKWRARGQELSEFFLEHGKLPPTASNADAECLRFFDEVEAAHALCIEDMTKVVKKAAKAGNWTAAAWWLERRSAEYFGKTKETKTEEVKPAAPKVQILLPDNGRVTSGK